ncbi:putative RNA-directed DNA polymerase [Helianthus annuus]|nr:putative RNA-directed DNA polymerase [Helianthus annuus]
MWVYLLKTKGEALAKFKIFKTQVEKESGFKIKMLRTDRGGEFNSQAFNDFCQETGIRRQKTVPYTPQQNGVVERRNRTVVGTIRAMLKTMHVPDEFWGEAAAHAVYVLNRVLTKAVKDKTPYEMWKKKRPNLRYMKIFGCIGYAIKLKGHVTKLEDRSRPLVYLGVEPGNLGFKMYDPVNKRVVVIGEGDVKFNEKEKWAWGQNSASTVTNPITRVHINTHVHASENEENDISKHATEDAGTPNHNKTSSCEEISSSSIKINPSSSDVDEELVCKYRPLEEVYQNTRSFTEEEVRDLYEGEELLLVDDEPTSYREAATDVHWRKAMQTELDSIIKNKTWTLVDLPSNHKAIGLKWVFKLKKDANGSVTKHKARLVAKGYVQQKGVDFDDVFAPVARLETIRLLLALAAKGNWLVHHLDVKSAFLNGELKEEVYVTQPSGFEVKGKEDMVYRLHKALYGLRQAPRAWNTKLDRSLKELGFSRCNQEQAVYKLRTSNSVIIVGVYVDDMIVTGSSEKDIAAFKQKMKTIFDMSDLGMLSYYLGIEVDQTHDGIIVKQEGYAIKVLKMAGMESCNEAKWPMDHKLKLTKDEKGKVVDATGYRRIIGSLRYLLHTRLDLSYSVGLVSRFMQSPKESHLAAVKQILRYLKGTTSYGLKYKRGGDGRLVGYSDSSHGTDREDCRSTTGTAFYFSGNLITWSSQKQKTVALSSCEAEFMAATSVACQALWLRSLLSELTGKETQKVLLLVDNESAIALMKNPVFHGRSKHIDTKFHFIRECVEREQIEVKHVSGELQKADTLTKALPRIKFDEMRSLVGVEDLKNGANTKGESVG